MPKASWSSTVCFAPTRYHRAIELLPELLRQAKTERLMRLIQPEIGDDQARRTGTRTQRACYRRLKATYQADIEVIDQMMASCRTTCLKRV